MANKKRDSKSKKTDIELSPEDPRELEIILDRLSVQSPEGESLENYLRSLGRALTGRESLVSALIEKLSRNPSEVGYQAFLALKGLVESKRYGRIIKQAAYRFSQRGYAAGTDVASQKKIVLIPQETRKPIAHLIAAPETFWLVSALVPEQGNPSSTGISVFPEEGFRALDIKAVESSQRLYREFVQGVASHLSRKAIEIPIWHAARLFFELLEFCGGSAVSSEVGRVKRILQPFYEPQKQPFAFEFMPVLDHPEKQMKELRTKELMEAVVSSWLYFPKNDLEPYRERVRELEQPLLVISPEIQRERTLDLIGKAADELCVGTTRHLYRRFFEEQALSMKLSSKEELAMSAWIVAQQLGSESKPNANPVICDLVVLSMKEYWPDDFGDEEDNEEEGPFMRTESGIILPK